MRLDHLLSKENREESQKFLKDFVKKCMFNFEDIEVIWQEDTRGCSSDGRAPALQAGGHEFDSRHLHKEGA